MKSLPVILATVLFLMPAISLADAFWGVELPQQQDGLVLCGAGLLKKGFFLKIYVGALYVHPTKEESKELEQRTKRIDIHYFHSTPKKHMINAAHSSLKKNLQVEEYNRLLSEFDKLHAAFLNGQKGSFASILHEPGKGLSYLFNNELKVFIPGDDFANAYFSIWLGDEPGSKTMKMALLKGWNL